MYCKVCFGEHEDDIHGATLRVRQWFRDEVLKAFEVEEEFEFEFADDAEETPAAEVA